MKVDVKKRKVDEHRVKLEVIIPSEEMPSLLKNAYLAIAYKSKIAPVENRTPKEMVLERFDEKDVQKMLCQVIMNNAGPFAISEKKVEIVGQPEYYARTKATEDKPFEFSMTIVVKPHFGLGIYDPVEVSLPTMQIGEKQIDERIAQIAEEHMQEVTDTSHDTVQPEDELEITLETTKDGEPVSSLTFESRPYKAGAQLMPNSFDNAIIGMKVGETKTFDFEGPDLDSESGEAITETYHCTATIVRLIKLVAPTITNAWVEVNMPECKNVEGLREMLRGELEKLLVSERESYIDFLCVSELAKRITDPISDAVYEASYAELMQSFILDLQQQGLTKQEFFEQQGIDEQQFSMEMMMRNRSQLTQQFALDALAENLRLTIDDSDREMFYSIAAPGHEEEARRSYIESGREYIVDEATLRMKANKWLSANSTIHVFDPAEADLENAGSAEDTAKSDE